MIRIMAPAYLPGKGQMVAGNGGMSCASLGLFGHFLCGLIRWAVGEESTDCYRLRIGGIGSWVVGGGGRGLVERSDCAGDYGFDLIF